MHRHIPASLSAQERQVHASATRGVAVLYFSAAVALIGFAAIETYWRGSEPPRTQTVQSTAPGSAEAPALGGDAASADLSRPTGDVWPAIEAPREAPATASTNQPPPVGSPDIRTLLADPAIRDFIGLSENAWDFTAPNGVPGFEPMPQDPARPNEVASKAPNGRAPHP